MPSTNPMATSEVVQCLVATLSPETSTRIAAELKLSELFTRPGMYLEALSCQISSLIFFAVFLSSFTEAALSLSQLLLAQDADMSMRQICFFLPSYQLILMSFLLSQHNITQICARAVVAILFDFQRICTFRRGEQRKLYS